MHASIHDPPRAAGPRQRGGAPRPRGAKQKERVAPPTGARALPHGPPRELQPTLQLGAQGSGSSSSHRTARRGAARRRQGRVQPSVHGAALNARRQTGLSRVAAAGERPGASPRGGSARPASRQQGGPAPAEHLRGAASSVPPRHATPHHTLPCPPRVIPSRSAAVVGDAPTTATAVGRGPRGVLCGDGSACPG
ncbi:hypothetical protein PVAP13_6KG296206 [Panicum virgatum]|uniref:Uncharacterized protein n=1 Tax=Panicum virgatum TaxID=38727 RepID=A0A8T0RG30_PANVG|nr:hypothetical protein PVAP13_6KG296206 [Panicum virgatum]